MFCQIFASPFSNLMIAAVCIFVLTTGETHADAALPPLLTVGLVRSDYEEHAKSWTTLPVVALEAIVAAEDVHFYSKAPQNSTITRQLGKRYINQAMQNLQLRIAQYYNATILARELSHAEIVNWYAHEVWLGEGCFGFPDAANAYFGKRVGELDVQDIALLAALIRSPAGFHPVRSRGRAIERRNHVLGEMQRIGYLTGVEAKSAIAANLDIREPIRKCTQ